MIDVFEQMLLNRFDMSNWKTGFVDHYSHMCISVDKSTLNLSCLSPRGLTEWREPMTDALCKAEFQEVGGSERLYPIYINQTDFLPWVVRQNGIVQTENLGLVSVETSLFSTEFNNAVWSYRMKSEVSGKFRFVFSGKLRFPEKKHLIKKCENGVICIYQPNGKQSKYLSFPQQDGVLPVFSIRTEIVDVVEFNEEKGSYRIITEPILLNGEKENEFFIQINYDTVLNETAKLWEPKKIIKIKSFDEEIFKRKTFWRELIGEPKGSNMDGMKILRSKAGLIRNEFLWNCGDERKMTVANYCSITNWSSACFFWDSIISSTGLMYFNIHLAEDAIKAIYESQREDGCVPTCSYEHIIGSTMYPQAPITAWALVHMTKYGLEGDFLKEIIPKIDQLHNWFINTQDHDRDGLPEWRFSGCPADNSPLYDHYALPINRDLKGMWNIYLPPIASVSLNSFLIMEAKCMAYLYNKIGETKKSDEYKEHALKLEKRLVEVCFENGEMFYDFDHHTGCYNRALTLYSFLPIWAGVSINREQRKKIIEDVLLNKEYFFGEYPFPHLAYNEEAYMPNGYWRGRVWPHTTLWMLELLWSTGYHREADEAADRILKMMGQREEILENYNSNINCPGGGEPDYSWSYASYLMIENREYRRPVLEFFGE